MFHSISILRLLALALLSLSLAACAFPSTPTPVPPTAAPAQPTRAPAPTIATSTLKVLAAETFLADIAQNVAGNRLKVDALIPIGVDPHGFEPTPADVRRVADSQVLIVNGAGFEEFLAKLLENAGGKRAVIEASAGLKSREAKEGEEAKVELSDADLAKAICGAAGGEAPKSAPSGKTATTATTLPGEEGLFAITLTKQADGTFAGYIKLETDEAGDFQIAISDGKLNVAQNAKAIAAEKKVTLKCAGLTQGLVVELNKGEAALALTGFKTDQAIVLVAPAGGHAHHHHAGDPHFWLDPNNVIKYVENIRDGLSQADPSGAATYQANASAYIAQLKQLDQWIAEQVKAIPPERRLLVTNHESFGYLADRYGFKIVGTIMPSVSTGASPSAQQLAALVNQIKTNKAKAIFLETGTNPQLAKQIAQETGIKVVTELYTHSITDAKGLAPTYIEMMKYNIKALVDALK
ncbi:MAG: zinc ABC transporter substrate-binding protein [Chloroflexi bacterium]|nr:zinc ABC transporter substrate-binding protein [Chloroflexota bacterium]